MAEVVEDDLQRDPVDLLRFLAQSVMRAIEPRQVPFSEDFRGVELVILVGGTSRLPFIRDAVHAACPGAAVVRRDYLDEMLATVRGAGFKKDFTDLIILRPPYTTEVRVTLADGSTHTMTVTQAFEEFPSRQFFVTSVPVIKKSQQFSFPIAIVKVVFISPAGKYVEVPEEQLPRETFEKCDSLEARLDINARLCLSAGGKARIIQAPYFRQVGLVPPRPFHVSQLNAPEVYPDDT